MINSPWQVPTLYALAARDIMDFIEVIDDLGTDVIDDTVMEELYTTLTYPNDKHDEATKSINSAAASIVEKRLIARQLNVTHGSELKEDPAHLYNVHHAKP